MILAAVAVEVNLSSFSPACNKTFQPLPTLPRHLLAPFLHKVVDNATKSAQRGDFTGPVARGDWQTVLEHLRALDGARPELRKAYNSYLHLADGSGHPVPEGLL